MARKLLIIFMIILFAGGVSYSVENEKLRIAVTHPWLALLANFIGGAEVEIIPLRVWNSGGELVLSEKGKILRELEKDSKIIAIDSNDLKSAGIDENNNKNFVIKCLYSPFPVKINSLSDPSVIPFVAQRILTALSEWDVQNYSHYQRRLAEFQARLSSSILVGQVLKDITFCDLSGSSGYLLMAAGAKVERPESFDIWQNSNGKLDGFREFLDSQRESNKAILIDDDTPANIKRYLTGKNDIYKWERPPLDVDYPSFLHEQYISLWQNVTKKKPLPRNSKR